MLRSACITLLTASLFICEHIDVYINIRMRKYINILIHLKLMICVCLRACLPPPAVSPACLADLPASPACNTTNSSHPTTSPPSFFLLCSPLLAIPCQLHHTFSYCSSFKRRPNWDLKRKSSRVVTWDVIHLYAFSESYPGSGFAFWITPVCFCHHHISFTL